MEPAHCLLLEGTALEAIIMEAKGAKIMEQAMPTVLSRIFITLLRVQEIRLFPSHRSRAEAEFPQVKAPECQIKR